MNQPASPPSSPYRVDAVDLNQEKGPLFVNRQTVAVGVYTPNRKKVYVLPYADRTQADTEHPSTNPNRVFCVRGDHYRDFALQGGPLTVFLLPQSTAPGNLGGAGGAALPAPRHINSRQPVSELPPGRPAPVHAHAPGGAGAPPAAAPAGNQNGGAPGAAGSAPAAPTGQTSEPNAPTGTSVKTTAGRSLPRPR